MVEHFGIERIGFLTLTFADHVVEPSEAQRRFNSLATHVLNDRFPAWLRVFERQKSGRIHYHLLVVCAGDVRTGADFAAFKERDYRSASPALRAEWEVWRATASEYGFGRTEVLPVRSTAAAIAKYTGKYIAKHIGNREERDKGVRLVTYSRGAGKANARFSWASPRAWLWRAKCDAWAEAQGCADVEDVRAKFGRHWSFKHGESIAAFDLSTVRDFQGYPNVKTAKIDGVFHDDIPDDATGIRVAWKTPERRAAGGGRCYPQRQAGLPEWVWESCDLEPIVDDSDVPGYVPPGEPDQPASESWLRSEMGANADLRVPRWVATVDVRGHVVAWDCGPPPEPF